VRRERRGAHRRGRAAPSTRLRRVRLGVSPHAPYTVSEPLYAGSCLSSPPRRPAARRAPRPSRERRPAGPRTELAIRRGVACRGIRVAARGRSPVEHLVRLGVLQPGTACLCIHCVQVDQRDVELLRTRAAAIAHCPRSNRAHGHGNRSAGSVFAAPGSRSASGRIRWSAGGRRSLVRGHSRRAGGRRGAPACSRWKVPRALALDAEIRLARGGEAGGPRRLPSPALSPALCRPLPPS